MVLIIFHNNANTNYVKYFEHKIHKILNHKNYGNAILIQPYCWIE